MNTQRLLHTLAQVKIALAQPHLYSAEQLKVFRRSRKKLNKQLQQFTNPQAPPRKLPTPRTPQLRLL